MKCSSRPALMLRTTVAATLLAWGSLAHAEGNPASDDSATIDTPVRALFAACAVRTGCEPWITDGTRDNTSLLRNLASGPPDLPSGFQDAHSNPHSFADVGDGRVAFTAAHRSPDGSWRDQPFLSDGTRSGTKIIRALPDRHSLPHAYTPLGDGRFVFVAQLWAQDRFIPVLWASDGTRQGTELIGRFPNSGSQLPAELTRLRDGQIVFRAATDRTGWELWTTDGTTEGTRLLRNITGDDRSSTPSELVQIAEGMVLFRACEDVNGCEPWVTDGTRRGTHMLANLEPGHWSSTSTGFTKIGDGLALFAAQISIYGPSSYAYITDGTREGTHLLQDATATPRATSPSEFTPLGDGRVLFKAWSSGGYQLWVTDGTSRRTRIVQAMAEGGPRHIRALGDGRAIFWHYQQARGYFALWVSDGTRRGTQRIGQFPNMTWAANQNSTTTASMGNGLALFSYDNGRTGWQPWVTDGTREGTGLLSRINRTGSSLSVPAFTPFNPAGD